MGFFSSLGNILKPVANIAAMIPGPHQAVAAPLAGILGAASGVGSIAAGRSKNRAALDAQKEGLDFARQRNQQTAPFRELALRDITGAGPEAPDLSVTYVDPTNPFASAAPRQALSLAALNGAR
jgi:hypothetical protein